MPGDPPSVFFDSSILLYLLSEEEDKARRVEALLIDGGTISVQVLNEIANVARRKMRMSWDTTFDLVQRLSALLSIVPVTMSIHNHGLMLAQRYQFAIYDSMVVAAALSCGCNILFSEDMHSGLIVERRMTISNPFVHLV
jgi:predicted nucleic acid-binding protein